LSTKTETVLPLPTPPPGKQLRIQYLLLHHDKEGALSVELRRGGSAVEWYFVQGAAPRELRNGDIGYVGLPGLPLTIAFPPVAQPTHAIFEVRAIYEPQASSQKPREKRKGGRRPLEQSNPLQSQVYKRIQEEHQPGQQLVETVKRLRRDANFVEQVKDASLGKLDTKLVRRAPAWFDQRERAAARKNQETDPA
jgi:hypothetical protein